VDTRDAMRMAREQDLDLVMVGEQAQPPVTKLMDYGRYRYELQQQAKETRKRSRSQDMKSIKFRIKIDRHDYETKVNHIKRFLKDGHKVKVTIMFRGRERTHPELGQDILNRVAADVTQLAVVDSAPDHRRHGHEHGPPARGRQAPVRRGAGGRDRLIFAGSHPHHTASGRAAGRSPAHEERRTHAEVEDP
jgi:translation initiation factor IF-3